MRGVIAWLRTCIAGKSVNVKIEFTTLDGGAFATTWDCDGPCQVESNTVSAKRGITRINV